MDLFLTEITTIIMAERHDANFDIKIGHPLHMEYSHENLAIQLYVKNNLKEFIEE